MKTKSSMREAFERMKIPSGEKSPVVFLAINAAKHGAGERFQRDWNAHLKYSTFNTLKSKGVM